jgi:tRNA-modifying protein YgfZ
MTGVSYQTSGVVERSPHGLVVVHGPDATKFLQSLVSQDLDAVADGEVTHSLLLSPQGKLDVAFRVQRRGDDWWLDCEADYGPRLAASLTRFKIRVKVDIDDRTNDTGMVSAIGVVPPVDSDAISVLRTSWSGVDGADLVGPIADVRTVFDLLDPSIERWSAERFEAFRIETGTPRLGVDIDDSTIPQEAFLERDAVSFTKGCFLGQELVTRIDTRGHVNKYLRRLDVEGSAVPPHGARVVVDDKDVGVLTSAAAVPGEDRVVALATVRREVEPPAAVHVRWDGGETGAEVRPEA